MKKLIAIALFAAAMTGSAFAHAHMKMSMPAANSTGKSPKSIMVHFSEDIESALSGFEVIGRDGTKIDLKPSIDGAMMMAPVKGRLAPGVYQVKWHAVSADGHRMVGDYKFTVK